jgi:glycosidase
MQWDGSTNSGFSAEKPWLTIDSNYVKNNVEIQSTDENSLLSFYKKLIWLKKGHTALQAGRIKFYEEYLPNLLVFEREDETEKLLVLLNFSNRQIAFMKPLKEKEKFQVLFGSHRKSKEELNTLEVNLRPYEVLILKET